MTLAKNDILSLFSQATQKVYSQAELTNLLSEHRQEWRLPKSTHAPSFILFLENHGVLQVRELQATNYDRSITRYSWGNASPLELAQSIAQRGYLCHATAITLHGLVKHDPKTIYLNVEQSAKPSWPVELTQLGIDRAFSGQQRQSKLIYKYGDTAITQIAGKNTKQLGIQTIKGPALETLQVTNLERTLIDIAVRPTYSGGISCVLEAYRAAKDRMDVDRLLTTLKSLDYAYPYHQAIGFLIQTAEYSGPSYMKLRELGLNYNFHLTHGIQKKQYCEDWRIFYPKDL